MSSDESNSSDDASTSGRDRDQGIGLSNPALSQSSRRMLDLINRLHATGVQVDIDLPQIAVIGSQSAGKSSLIESISGITLPRAAGTCTRSTEPWKCSVFLRILESGKMQSEKFGDVITDRSFVEERIKRAQWAILNPTVRNAKGVTHFLAGDDHGSSLELSFSKNYVSLQISGPDVADLSFCDLPGLIAGVGMGGDKNDIDLVKELVASYIKRPSCIILLTVACETDFQNQGAQEMAKTYDPQCKRTIGVLTKPDRIPTGEEPNWISLIRNEKEALDNGWYCVKQPSSAQINAGMTWAGARKSEDVFFASTPAWSELDSMYQKYLRTGNLVERLSIILSDLISKRLPEIQEEIERVIASTREALKNLPKPPSADPRNEIAELVYQFVRDVYKHVEGVPQKDGLLQTIRPAQEKFRRAVRSTAPDFQPYERRFRNTKTIGKAKFLEDEEGHEDFDVSDSESDSDSDSRFTPGVVYSVVPTGKEIYIDEVFRSANEARTRELPGNYPFVVQRNLIQSVVKEWRAPAQLLGQSVYRVLVERVMSLVHDTFGEFGQGQLEQRVKRVVLVQDHVSKCMDRTEERIDRLLNLEDLPFTLNTHYFCDYKEKFLIHYRSARERDRHSQLVQAIQAYSDSKNVVPPVSYGLNRGTPDQPTGVAKVLSGLAEIGVHGIKPEVLVKLMEPDGMEPALLIMADVRAYFQVAYKRFVDNVPLVIDYELMWGSERGVLQWLNTGLGINGPDGNRICQELAQESPTVAARRDDLTKKLARMQFAAQQLLQIGF
ncbi:hypothetical protein H0H81_002114 [Sphagnurus paluster]|uniref:Uncharacterized protein n=1 Tax=Sphagnurus paluster TaxID=117069 RepID=A0A9P7K410_9AGAR|nr:hypothetical protein H0H81_002114 [Sphagnurus paluster]